MIHKQEKNQINNLGEQDQNWIGLTYKTAASLRSSLIECLMVVPVERLDEYLRDVPDGCLRELCIEVIDARNLADRFFQKPE